ncbi:hypothetical protein KXD93_30445 [Mucilaginibacter sp. BJC16-A38]|uniref:hypothetical protein n=1 Tax=Mucilaginibacter phenanthrenivorans TaxID=1234842 RepID=UPI00215745BD|nr:hypothetical protein [Mucilaginibacter phenanthrenivorans]MCR8562014.1 hypothetical protein [Mucilaginibacter phenanthrenivorans]
MLIRKYVSVGVLTVVLLFTIKNSFGQQQQFIPDSAHNIPKKITWTEFHSRVDRAVKLLQTKELSAISDSDHVNIMLCLNTIFLGNRFLKGFNDARCKRLLYVANEKDYKNNIGKVYPEWLFNRGMGQYYPKLKMELYGTPNLYAIFIISNK